MTVEIPTPTFVAIISEMGGALYEAKGGDAWDDRDDLLAECIDEAESILVTNGITKAEVTNGS